MSESQTRLGDAVPRVDARLKVTGQARYPSDLPVDDPARSVSKTHAVLQETQEGVRVTDLHSTNGVSVIDASGATTALAAGTAAALDAGATVLLGSFRLRLVQA